MNTPKKPAGASVLELVDGTAPQLRQLDEARNEDKSTPPVPAVTPPPFELKSLSQLEWTKTQPVRLAPLLEFHHGDNQEPTPYLPSAATCVIAGAPGVGKSMLVQQMAMAIAGGETFLGKSSQVKVVQPRSVLMLMTEESEELAHARFHDAYNHFPSSPAAESALFPIVLYGKGHDRKLLAFDGERFVTTPTWEEIRRVLNEPPPQSAPPWGLVVCDTYARLMPGQAERAGSGTDAFEAAFEPLTLTRDRPSVLVVHHVNKAALAKVSQDKVPSLEDVRGGTDIIGAARWVASVSSGLKDDEADVRIDVLKANSMAQPPKVRLSRGVGGLLSALPDDTAAPSSLRREADLSAACKKVLGYLSVKRGKTAATLISEMQKGGDGMRKAKVHSVLRHLKETGDAHKNGTQWFSVDTSDDT